MSDAFLPVERIQDLTDGPGEMGPSDHGKFMTWDDTAGHMVMVALPKPERPQVVGVAFGGGTGGGGGTTDHAALTHLDFVSSGHTGFEAVGAGAAAVAAHVALANPHSQYLLASAVSAYGLTLIDDADATTARATLGLGALATAGVPGATTQVISNQGGVLTGDAGLTYDPATDALTVAGRVVTGVIRPPSNSTTAGQWQNASGTAVLTIDTTNSVALLPGGYISIGNAGYDSRFHVYVDVTNTANVIRRGSYYQVRVDTTSQALSSAQHGFYGKVFFSAGGNNATSVMYGAACEVQQATANTLTDATGILANPRNTSTGTITTARGLRVTLENTGGGTITNAYGVYVDDIPTASTAKYAIYTNAGDIRLMASNSDKIGFHGVTPVARQLLATGAGATVDQVITALQTLGLLRQS